MSSVLYKNVGIVSEGKILRQDILESAGQCQVDDGHGNELSKTVEGANHLFVIPAFMDIHTHGAAGFDFTLGNYDPETGLFQRDKSSFFKGLAKACKYYKDHGAGGIYLTTMAASVDDLKKSFEYLYEFLEQDDTYRNLIRGINLEGTFIKDPDFAGAQSATYFQPLSQALFQELQEAAQGLIKIVNIPPDHGENALPIITGLRKDGLVVAAGHSGAYGDEAEKAIEAGVNLGVHYLNGPNRRSPKGLRNGGVEESLLIDDRVSLELILDGIHVDPRYVRDVIARKGIQRVIGITDSMFVTGCPEISAFSLLGLNGQVSAQRTHLVVEGKADTLFGSILQADKAFENLVRWFSEEMTGVWHRNHVAMSTDQAVLSACQVMTYNVCRLLDSEIEKSLLVEVSSAGTRIISEVDGLLT